MATLAEQAQKIATATRQRIDNISHDNGLTEQGRLIAAAKEYLVARDQIEALRTRHEAEASTRKAELTRRVIGLPNTGDASAMISYRDAQDRATQLEKIEGADALSARIRALQSAAVSGDEHLAKAILGVALRNGWEPVVDEYNTHYPTRASYVNELWDILTPKSDREKMFGGPFHFPPYGPVQGYGENQIETLAKQTLSTPSPSVTTGWRDEIL